MIRLCADFLQPASATFLFAAEPVAECERSNRARSLYCSAPTCSSRGLSGQPQSHAFGSSYSLLSEPECYSLVSSLCPLQTISSGSRWCLCSTRLGHRLAKRQPRTQAQACAHTFGASLSHRASVRTHSARFGTGLRACESRASRQPSVGPTPLHYLVKS